MSAWATIKSDLYRHHAISGIKGFCTGWYKPGFRYLFLWRLATSVKSSLLRWVIRAVKRRYRIRYGFEISNEAQIGEGFYLSDHIGPVVIGPVKIGKFCNVAHSVTIGRAYNKQGEIGRPTIGDYVWIGPGAVLVGNIKIGDDVMIAPNSFVNFDVPDNSVVIGNPGKIISKQNPTKHYICYVPDDGRRKL